MMQRRGFTLLEILLAAALMGVVLFGATKSFFGVRASQGHLVANNLMKVAGQKALNTIYAELSQSRRLLASSSLAPPPSATNPDKGADYLNRFEGLSTVGTIPTGNMQFPRIDENGGFGLAGADSGELEQNTVGNTLVFVGLNKTIEIKTPGISLNLIGGGSVTLTAQPYMIPAYRFVGYFLVERPLPAGTPKLAGTRTVTQQLMRFESRPYLEKADFAAFSSSLGGTAGVAAKTVWDDLVAKEGVVGLWDSSAALSADAFYTVDGSGAIVKVASPVIYKKRYTLLAQTNLSPYALGMVAFNTSPTFAPTENAQPIAVPAYALTDTAHANFPYGFEVAIVGPSGARSVLIRLALAARLNQGLHLYGLTQQEVVKVMDM